MGGKEAAPGKVFDASLEIIIVRQLGIRLGFCPAVASGCSSGRLEVKVLHDAAHNKVNRDSILVKHNAHESSAAFTSILKSSSDSESSVIFFFGFVAGAGFALAAVPLAALPLEALAAALFGFGSSTS